MTARQRENAYDNGFAPDNVYGKVLELLQRHRVEATGALHLDVGCGFGRIAEPLVTSLGLRYVGCDLDELGLASLTQRGFEAHCLVLADEESVYKALVEIVAGRPVASISIIDTLEHLDEPAATVRALRRLAAEHSAFVLISVPNTAHQDIGLRLLFGRWEYTEAGILDHTHRTLFSDSVLRRMLVHSGLHIVAANDVEMTRSDQAFPDDHPALAPATTLSEFLTSLRRQGDAFGRTNQLVRLCAPGPIEAVAPYIERDDARRPFLSIVMRTQGKRKPTLVEVMTCLAGQSVIDFEVLIIGHLLDTTRQISVEQVIEDLPVWLRNKTRLIRVDHGGRTRPLNVGFAEANGQYIVILDDDDIVFGNWVETFVRIASSAPGRILRAVSVQQTIRNLEFKWNAGIRATSTFDAPYPTRFDFFEHLRINHSPGLSLAFPRGVFHHLNLEFDETLTTTEDWDYLLRTASLVGVASDPSITSVYRRWEGAENSLSQHSQEEWDRNFVRVKDKLDSSVQILWPIGTAKRIRSLYDEIGCLQGQVRELDQQLDGSKPPAICAERIEALRQVVSLYSSTSWRLSAAIRWVSWLMSKKLPDETTIWSLSTPELHGLADAIRRSTSWRVTAPLRRLSAMVTRRAGRRP